MGTDASSNKQILRKLPLDNKCVCACVCVCVLLLKKSSVIFFSQNTHILGFYLFTSRCSYMSELIPRKGSFEAAKILEAQRTGTHT